MYRYLIVLSSNHKVGFKNGKEKDFRFTLYKIDSNLYKYLSKFEWSIDPNKGPEDIKSKVYAWGSADDKYMPSKGLNLLANVLKNENVDGSSTFEYVDGNSRNLCRKNLIWKT